MSVGEAALTVERAGWRRYAAASPKYAPMSTAPTPSRPAAPVPASGQPPAQEKETTQESPSGRRERRAAHARQESGRLQFSRLTYDGILAANRLARANRVWTGKQAEGGDLVLVQQKPRS